MYVHKFTYTLFISKPFVGIHTYLHLGVYAICVYICTYADYVPSRV